MTFAAIFISLLALVFTVSSFWWLHVRQGPVITWPPSTWAAHIGQDRSALRLPLAIYNTGAAPRVLLRIRLHFLVSGELLDWEWTRTQVDPEKDDVQDVRKAFAIPGRTVYEFVPEFTGQFPGRVPSGQPHRVSIEAVFAGKEQWITLDRFTLNLANLIHPTHYIVYTNDANYLDEQQLQEGTRRRDRLRESWGLPATESLAPPSTGA